jgi:hypothetical protein
VTQKQRWIKVSISYREGDRLDQWDAVTLGDTSMGQAIRGTSDLVIQSELRDFADVVRSAAVELVKRSERIAPLELVEPVPA